MGQGAALISRRSALLAAAALVAGCDRPLDIAGGFVADEAHVSGHRLREGASWPNPATSRRAQVVVAGGGIAGLAAARALRQRGIDDFVVLDLEQAPGGNSRAGQIHGIACPLGATHLRVPGDDAPQVQALLEELGLRRRVAGRWEYDQRHLCRAPRQRVFFQGQWQEGRLPLQGAGAETLAQSARFVREVEKVRATAAWRSPMRDRAQLRPWDGETFATWLGRRGLDDPQLRWFLDHQCRRDHGAGSSEVAAWAGLHAFATRPGLQPPGASDGEDGEALLTWPEGNGWLSRALALPLAERWRGGRMVVRIAERRHGIEVDTLDPATGRLERWLAQRCIVTLPAFVVARVVENPPEPLRQLARQARHAPWLVANLHLRAPPAEKGDAPLSWDNVVHGPADSLGYVHAGHQDPARGAGPTVLTWSLAPGEAARGALLRQPWTHWRDRILSELSAPHADLPGLVTQIDIARYGHALPIPVPGALSALPAPPDSARVHYAHSDWAGYSVFAEAFTLGHEAGSR